MALRLAVLGCGGMSTTGHGPALARLATEFEGLELVACCDLEREKAERYAARFGFARVYTDWERLVEGEAPDAISLFMPVDRTCPMFCAVVGRGLPCFTEKPPGLTVAELDQMMAAAGQTPHQVAFNRRFQPLIRHLKTLLPPPGELQHVHYELHRINRRDRDFSTTAIHGLDAVRHLAGADYATWAIRDQPRPEAGPTVANLLLDGTLTSGATCHLSFLPCSGAVVERAFIAAAGRNWYLELPIFNGLDQPGRLRQVEGNRVVAEWSGDTVSDGPEPWAANGFYGENRAWVEALLSGQTPPSDLASARQSVEVMEAVRQHLPPFRGC